MSDAVIGEIRLMATSSVPSGWLECDGKEFEADKYPELYVLIGCTYGGVWGKTFKLPDLRGRLAVGATSERGSDGFPLGAKFGEQSVALQVSQLPAHGHGFNVTNQPATSPEPGKTLGFGNPPSTQSFYIDTTQPTNGSLPFSSSSIGVSLSGGTREVHHNNVMPCVALRFIICTRGLFPSFA